jgi:ATP-dependent DNA ligase
LDRQYPSTAAALAKVKVRSAYLDGELCGVRPDGDRKRRLAVVLKTSPPGVMFNDHETGDGEAFRRAACKHGLEGTVSKRADRPYLPDDRGAWIKTKCLSRAESVVVRWTGPEGSRPFLGALLLGYFDNDGRLLYAGRVGTGMSQKTLALLHRRLKPLVIRAMPLAAPPTKETRFGGKLALSRVHWVRPELVAEITYLSWTEDGLLRRTVFVASREDTPASEVRREKPA